MKSEVEELERRGGWRIKSMASPSAYIEGMGIAKGSVFLHRNNGIFTLNCGSITASADVEWYQGAEDHDNGKSNLCKGEMFLHYETHLGPYFGGSGPTLIADEKCSASFSAFISFLISIAFCNLDFASKSAREPYEASPSSYKRMASPVPRGYDSQP